MKRIFAILLVLFAGVVCLAQGEGCRMSGHEFRIGIGDMLFETVRWHNQVHRDYSAIAEGLTKPEDVRFAYTPHFSAEYAYRLDDWISIGLIGDFQYTSWERNYYNRHDVLTETTRENFFNLSFLLSFRFDYFRREHFGIYSSIAPGIDINGGSEKDCFGNNTLAGPAIDLRLVGFRLGGGQCWGFAEFGLMAALKDPDHIFLFGSQILKVGFTYKFKRR